MRAAAWILAALGGLATLGCERIDLERMIHQRSIRPYEARRDDPSAPAMRHPPEGTVPVSRPDLPAEILTGRRGSAYVDEVPVPVHRRLLDRGRDRFRIFCATCHGARADGQSQVAENMRLVPPPSLLEEKYRDYPAGRLYEVVRHGFGLMRPYADALPVDDRWAVVAWVRVLQLSQRAQLSELPPTLQEEFARWPR